MLYSNPKLMGAAPPPLLPIQYGANMWGDGSDPAGTGIAPADNSKPTRIFDKSLSGNHFDQASSIRQMTFKANIQNGLGIMRDDGSRWYDAISVIWPSDKATAFLVINNTGLAPVNLFTGNEAADLDFQTAQIQVKGGVTGFSVGAYLVTSTYVLLEVHRESGNSKAFVNGVQSGITRTESLDTITPGIFSIGTRALDRAVPLEGDFCEFISFPRILTDLEKANMREFLRAKWNLY